MLGRLWLAFAFGSASLLVPTAIGDPIPVRAADAVSIGRITGPGEPSTAGLISCAGLLFCLLRRTRKLRRSLENPGSAELN